MKQTHAKTPEHLILHKNKPVKQNMLEFGIF